MLARRRCGPPLSPWRLEHVSSVSLRFFSPTCRPRSLSRRIGAAGLYRSRVLASATRSSAIELQPRLVGRARIRTCEGVSRGVYSAAPLAAWIPARDWLQRMESNHLPPAYEAGERPVLFAANWRRVKESNHRPLGSARFSRPVALHSAPPSVLVVAG